MLFTRFASSAVSLLALASAFGRAPGEAPSGTLPAHIGKGAVTILPNGRLLTPLGRQFRVAPHPFGLALSRDGRTLVSANSGVGPFSITVIKDPAHATSVPHQVPPGGSTEASVMRSVFMGLAFAPDGRTLYVSGGNDGNINVIDVVHTRKTGTISCNVRVHGKDYEESYIGDLAISPDGRFLYAVDQANFRLVVVDTARQRVTGSASVGRYPFAVAVSPNGKRVFVANIGMFEYQPIQGGTLPYPPFGVPSKEAEAGVEIDGKKALGLGSPNVPESFSVWGLNVTDPTTPKVTARIKTGTLVGQTTDLKFPAVGGSVPNSLVVTATRAYVTNGNNDNVQVIDTARNRIIATIPLGPVASMKARGVLPFGLALAPDGKRLYVAEAGINAVAVIDTLKKKVLGHIPAGWYPSKVQVSPDGKMLCVSSAKGLGSGPNGGPNFKAGPEGTYVGSLMKGIISVMKAPADTEMPAMTQRVLTNNGFPPPTPSPVLKALGNAIKHVVFITKENRTFDEVFGDLPGVNGEPSLARYGAGATVSGEGQPTVTNVNVMPNHRALAKQFGIGDNFYADGDVSADGHRWLVGIYPNEWHETQVAASYGGQATYSTKTPGRRAFFGSDASAMPEDYNEAGSIFDHLARHSVPFRNYGEGFEFAGVEEDSGTEPTGARESLNIPMSKPLFENTSREFPIFNMFISDQYRASQFIKDVRKWDSGQEPMPRFINIALPNDHGAGLRPGDGYPYVASYMADNDLALGRIVEALSHTRFWKSMAIFITEDDAQSGVDHVDAHRTLLLAVGPHVKPGYISHRHGSIPSVIHTINLLLGLPALNQFDATTSDLLDFFGTTANYQPYVALPEDSRIFDPSKVKDISRQTDATAVRRDDPAELQREHDTNR